MKASGGSPVDDVEGMGATGGGGALLAPAPASSKANATGSSGACSAARAGEEVGCGAGGRGMTD